MFRWRIIVKATALEIQVSLTCSLSPYAFCCLSMKLRGSEDLQFSNGFANFFFCFSFFKGAIQIG